MSTTTAHELADDDAGFLPFLSACVAQAVGAAAAPRPGQQSLALAILRAFRTRTHTADEAPTGTGKSLAALSAAAWVSMTSGERTVISTLGLPLLEQYAQQDSPHVLAAAAASGATVEVAVLKGTNNYIDPRRVLATLSLLGIDGPKTIRGADLEQLIDRLDATVVDSSVEYRLARAFDDADPGRVKPLLHWALTQYLDEDLPGDRQSCPLPATDAEWFTVAAVSGEAAKSAEEGRGLEPKARLAKARAAEADIVITNHVLPAVQAATSLPIIIGSEVLGPFDHIVVDEAHELPGIVRAQGESRLSAGTVHQVSRRVTEAAAAGPALTAWQERGRGLANVITTSLQRELAARVQRPNERTVSLDPAATPSAAFAPALTVWLDEAVGLLGRRSAAGSDEGRQLHVLRSAAAIDRARAALAAVAEHVPGQARWIEQQLDGAGGAGRILVAASPVLVAGRIRSKLWQAPSGEGADIVEQGDDDAPEPLGVACMSATLAAGFTIEAGLSAQQVSHPSPFTDAYTRSALYIPAPTSDVLPQTAELVRGRWRFDLHRHRVWAANAAVELVRANDGRALVLTATSAAGKLFTETLRSALPDITTLSQWDGENLAVVKRRWVDAERSVLVGTKSLMTGVDAPGETCSLVILDRPPRAASNPIDDARVELLTARGMDRWSADRIIYVGDAALITEQAVGRLIRAVHDTGMVALLDPRLLRGSPLSYPEPTRRAYLRFATRFGTQLMLPAQAQEWLRSRRAAG